MARRRAIAIVAALALSTLAACGDGAPKSRPAPVTARSGSAASVSPSATAGPAPTAMGTVTISVPAGMTAAPFNVPRHLTIPAGWSAAVVARIAKARFMALTPSGDLLVSQPSTGKVLIVPQGGGAPAEFVGGLNNPHDMVFTTLNGRPYLFISQADRVVRYPYANGDTRAPAGEVVVDGLPDTSTPELHGQYAHVLKNIAVKDGVLYVSIASTCNACPQDTTSDPQRAAIYTYDAAGHNANRQLLAHGLRNAEGLAFAPGSADLWAVVNNRDNALVPDTRDVTGDGKSDQGKRLPQFVDNYPLEEFVKVKAGAFYGWPFCNPDSANGHRNLPFDRDYELNPDGRKADCAKATPIDVGIDAHTAPLGLTFTPDLGAVVPLHGSWNRTKPAGYKVIRFPWTATGPGPQTDLATGWLDGTNAWGRPVDAALDTDGTLLISDDGAGAVIRLSPPAPS
jgi:glucose/arabinose dehydrogenase